jgi:hypothetical protein
MGRNRPTQNDSYRLAKVGVAGSNPVVRSRSEGVSALAEIPSGGDRVQRGSVDDENAPGGEWPPSFR